MSVYRDDEVWQARLQRDQGLIKERLDDEQKRVLEETPEVVGETLPVQFVLVIGSRARGEHREESDLDLYIAAEGAPDDPERAPVVPNQHFQVLIVPPGVLLNNCRAGEEYALSFAQDGLVARDNGTLRSTLIALDEEGIVSPPD
jgi:Polymerase beta, Nucleotidyltransferase